MSEIKRTDASKLYDSVIAGEYDQSLLGDTALTEVLEVKHGFNKETVLLSATWNSQHQIVQLLLQAQAQVNAQNHVGRTSLMHACINDHLECVRLLLSHAADVTVRDRCGMTALHFAAKCSCTGQVLCLLLDAGADVNRKCSASAYTWYFQSIDRDLQTHLFSPLHFAALACRADSVALLLQRGAHPQAVDGKGRTALKLMLFHAQHMSSSVKDCFYRTRELLTRKHVAAAPPRVNVERGQARVADASEEGPQTVTEKDTSLLAIRKGLVKVRNDLMKDYRQSKQRFEQERVSASELEATAEQFETQTNHRVAEANEYLNAAIATLDHQQASSANLDDYTCHRIFSYVAKHVGSKKGAWEHLGAVLLGGVAGLEVAKTLSAVWSHSTTEVEAAHELLVRWKHYSGQQPDVIARVKQALTQMAVSKAFILHIDELSRETLPEPQTPKAKAGNKQKHSKLQNKNAIRVIGKKKHYP